MKTTNMPINADRPTLLEAMATIENGQKWWTLPEITRLLKELGWIGARSDQMRKRDIIPMLSLAIGNQRLEVRYNDEMKENEFRLQHPN